VLWTQWEGCSHTTEFHPLHGCDIEGAHIIYKIVEYATNAAGVRSSRTWLIRHDSRSVTLSRNLNAKMEPHSIIRYRPHPHCIILKKIKKKSKVWTAKKKKKKKSSTAYSFRGFPPEADSRIGLRIRDSRWCWSVRLDTFFL
jgi:hypothetical protein